MIRYYNLTAIILLLFAVSGCKEFIEPSIQDKQVVLLAPSSGTESSEYAQTFWWEEVEDALNYRLQVVSPDFNNTKKLVLDTLVSTNKFSFTLDPGTYEWRVRAENGSSQTLYKSASFVIYSTSITEQQPQLQSPANNLLTNNPSVTFKWLKLYGATQYQLEIDTNNFATSVLFFKGTTENLEYTVPLTKDKVYRWRVKALSDTIQSRFSVVQNITYDTTPPSVPILISPATGTTTASPAALRWNASSTAVKYKLYLYKSDKTTIYNNTYPVTLTGTSYSFTSGTFGEQVYWEVVAIDEAGNISAASTLWDFTIQ